MMVLKLLQFLFMDKPIGGRGHKAPYETVVVRIPRPLEPVVLAMVDSFREEDCTGVFSTVSLAKAVRSARKVLAGKKSARVSLVRLLGLLYLGSEAEL